MIFHWRDANGLLPQVALRQQPGRRMKGFMDYTDDAVTTQLDWYRNGELVRMVDSGAEDSFPLPDLAITGWSFHAVTGQFHLRGQDENGNTWRFSVTPTMALGAGPLTGAAITVATRVPGRTFVDGVGQGAE